MRDATDYAILEYASLKSLVVVTLDLDFPQMMALMGATRPSVVLIRQQKLQAAEVAALIASVWKVHESALDQGCVVKVNSRNTRSRLLPLR